MRKKKKNAPRPTETSLGIHANEASIAYDAALPSDGRFNMVFGLNKPLASDFDWLTLSRSGISKYHLLALAKLIALTIQELSAIMHISERTLQRYDDGDIVRPEYTSRAVELARLYSRGEEVFGTLDAFKSWMKTPNYAFNNETPLQLLDTSIGFGLVLDEIGRIEHGILV